MKQFNDIFNQHEKIRFLQLAVLMVVGSFMETGAIYLMLPFVTAIMDMEALLDIGWIRFSYQIFAMGSAEQLVVFLSIFMAILYVVKSLYQYWVSKLKFRYIGKKRSEFSAKVFGCIMHKPYSYHIKTNTAEIQQITVQDIDRTFSLVNSVFVVISNVFTGGLILAVLLAANAALTGLSLLMILGVMILVNKVIIKRVNRAGEENTRYYMEQVKWINQATGGLKGIYSNRRQDLFVNQYAQAAKEYAKVASSFQTLVELPKRSVEGVCMSGIFLIVAMFAGMKNDLREMLPTLATFAMAAYRLMPVANAMNEALNGIRFHRISLNTVHKILTESQADLTKPVERAGKPRPLAFSKSLQKGIELQGLSFRYEDGDTDLFHNISLKIPARKSVAFIGTTGVGKTTLADLILGLQMPQSGKILADGVDIVENGDWWADRIGYIPQYIYLCDDTIRANVAFAIPEEDAQDARVWECLEKAQLKEFVEGLPHGLDTVTGENGIRLSGGQRQRIGIARAMYADPPFLVMDEATSALDNETESAIIAAINQLAGEKTILIIAHRLTTIRDCDIVYRIEKEGICVEKGLDLVK